MTTTTTSADQQHLLPKHDSQAYGFVQKYPKYDGTNVIIGILDTGIDPGSSIGIQYMSDGVQPKLIDLVDCTGSGDVDISTTKVVKEDKTNPSLYYEVQGLSGKKLKLKKSWFHNVVKNEEEDNNKRRTINIDITQSQIGYKTCI